MPPSPAFVVPDSLNEAIGQLEHYGDEAMAVAGATAVTIMLQQRLVQPAALVSLGRLDELRGISIDDERLTIGALTTHREVELNDQVTERLPVLSSTFGRVANVRVRNAATVGGVVAEADYASDPPALLMALDAEVEIAGPGGERSVPIGEFLVGFYETALVPGEVVTRIRVPLLPDGSGAVYEKYTTRSSEDRPCIGVAAVAGLDSDGRCRDLRVAVGAAAETPQRFRDVEQTAIGSELDEGIAHSIADRYAERIDPLSDMRGSAWYRREMIRVWVRRAIGEAARRAAEAARSPGRRGSAHG